MKRLVLSCASLAAGFAVPVQAADTKLNVTAESTNYSGSLGNRREVRAESSFDLGATAFSFAVSNGTRKFADESHSAVQVAGSIYHDWNERLYTRTSLSASSERHVFAKREVAHDFNFKLRPSVVVTAGAKLSQYAGGTTARALSAGGSWYFKQGLATYRFSSYDVDRLGRSRGHLLTVRLKDGRGPGATQLWLGSGSSLHEVERLGLPGHGKHRGFTVQRLQPLAGPLLLRVGLGRNWYRTPGHDFRGTNATLGISINSLASLFGRRSNEMPGNPQ